MHWAVIPASAVVMVVRFLLMTVALFVLAVVVGVLGGVPVADEVFTVGDEVAGALAVAAFAGDVLRWRTTTYQLTTWRLQLRSGILSRSGRDLPLARISGVSFSRGLPGRLLGYGDLVVDSPGQEGKLVLRSVPAIERVQATLFRLVEDEQARLAREDKRP